MKAGGSDEYIKASFIDPETHQGLSFYEFESQHKHSIVLYYYLAFSFCETLPLLILSACFLDSRGSQRAQDFRVARFYFYAGLPLFAIIEHRQAGVALQRISRDYRTRNELWVYLAAAVVVTVSTLMLLQSHTPANALLAVRGKFAFSICLRLAKRFPLKTKEMRFLAMFASFLVCLAMTQSDAFWDLGWALLGGATFFAAETLLSPGLTLDESDLVTSAAQLLISCFYFFKAAFGAGPMSSAAPLELVWAFLIPLAAFGRFWVLKRFKYIQNDSTAEAYNELLVIFAGAVAALLSLPFSGARKRLLETVVALIGLVAFATYRQKELQGLFQNVHQKSIATEQAPSHTA